MKKAIVLVSFGTSNIKGIEKSIDILIEELNEKLGPEYKIINTFTSDRIRCKLKNFNNIYVYSLKEGLESLSKELYEEVYIKPLHVFDGSEIEKIKDVIDEYRGKFSSIKLGNTLLGYDERELEVRCDKISSILLKDLNGPLLFIGHGSRLSNHDQYDSLITSLRLNHNDKVYFGTLEGKEPIQEVLINLKRDEIKNISIVPLLIVPGKHFIKDIVLGEYSWKAILNKEKIVTNCINKALLQYEDIRNIIYRDIIKM